MGPRVRATLNICLELKSFSHMLLSQTNSGLAPWKGRFISIFYAFNFGGKGHDDDFLIFSRTKSPFIW